MRFKKIKQVQYKKHRFKCGHSSILPKKGTGNKKVLWNKSKKKWICRPCLNKYYDDKRKTPIGWAQSILFASQYVARKLNYAPPNITPEELIEMVKKAKFCVACQEELPAFRKGKGNDGSPHLHHDHQTGRVHGFAHPNCNVAEGHFAQIKTITGKVLFLKNTFPEVVECIKSGLI